MKVTLVTLRGAQSGTVQDKALFINGKVVVTTNSDVTRLHNIDQVAVNVATSSGVCLETIEHQLAEGETWSDISTRYFSPYDEPEEEDDSDINVKVVVNGGCVQGVDCADTHGRNVNVEIIDYDVECTDPEHLEEVDDGTGNISHASVSSWEFKSLTRLDTNKTH